MKILGQNAHWILNKELVKDIGLEPALMLSDLIDKSEYFNSRGEIISIDGIDGYFYNTIENIERDTTLSNYKQKRAINILKSKGYIHTKLCGIPAKLYFKPDEIQILSFLKTRVLKTSKLDVKKFKTNNNKLNNNKIIEHCVYVGNSNREEIEKELETFIQHWNKTFGEQRKATSTLLSIYKTIRKEYSKEDFKLGYNSYKNKKLEIKQREGEFKYLLSPLAFLKRKENGFISYL